MKLIRKRNLTKNATLYLAALLLVAGYAMPMIAAADTPPQPTATYEVQVPPPTDTSGTDTSDTTDTTDSTTPSDTTAADPTPSSDTSTPATSDSSDSPVTSTTGDSDSTDTSTTTTADNSTDSTATSGDATVTKNTSAGSATSGDASASATILNNVNSTISSSDNQKAASFVSNVMGDVNGDIILQPMLLKAMLESSATPSSDQTTNVSTTTNATNNVDLSAGSGNATVSDNTKAGDATTGDATTVAQVVNIINSLVSAKQSFVGTINIYGNLNGDILIAPDFIPQLLAANGGNDSSSVSGAQVINASDTQSIVNNVSLAAKSGAAAVLGNTSAGSATSGDASTNLVIFNLSGHAIVAQNSLLVFVNVLGKWVGVIVDAPQGATAAAIGSGVTSDATATPDMVVNATSDTTLTNNITLSSQSGDALVTGNTQAGNATSGNATASAAIGNIVGDEFGLSGWFGILFINVFGSWYGDFGINTPYGDPVTTSAPGIGYGSLAHIKPKPVEFVPHGSAGTPVYLTTVHPNQAGQYIQQASDHPAVLAAATTTTPSKQHVLTPVADTPTHDYRLYIALGALALLGVSGAALRRLIRGW